MTPTLASSTLGVVVAVSAASWVLLAAAESGPPSDEQLLRRVCKGEQIYLTSSQLEKLANEIRGPTSEAAGCCSREGRDSIVALHGLLSDGEARLCSPEKTKLIGDFFDRYVVQAKWRAPRAARLLFASYGLKLSRACRQRMVGLILDTPRLLGEPHLAEFNSWTDASSQISSILPEPSDYDQLVLPRQLTKLLRSKPERMFLLTSTGEKLRHFQALCERRLKPIYEPLILPLIELAELGFDYKRSRREESLEEANRLVFRWYRAVFLCESLAGLMIVSEPSSGPAGERNILRIFGAGDETVAAEQEALARQQLAASYPDLARLDYSPAEPSGAQLSEPIADPNDAELARAVQRFKRNRRLELNFAHRVYGQFKDRLARGLFKLASGKQTPSANELIKAMDEEEHALASAGSSAVRYGYSRTGRFLRIAVPLLLFAGFLATCITLAIVLPHAHAAAAAVAASPAADPGSHGSTAAAIATAAANHHAMTAAAASHAAHHGGHHGR